MWRAARRGRAKIRHPGTRGSTGRVPSRAPAWRAGRAAWHVRPGASPLGPRRVLLDPSGAAAIASTCTSCFRGASSQCGSTCRRCQVRGSASMIRLRPPRREGDGDRAAAGARSMHAERMSRHVRARRTASRRARGHAHRRWRCRRRVRGDVARPRRRSVVGAVLAGACARCVRHASGRMHAWGSADDASGRCRHVERAHEVANTSVRKIRIGRRLA
jgi:hypothetical protein